MDIRLVLMAFLLPQNFFDLANLSLNFAGHLFGFAFDLQLGIIGDFSSDLLNGTRRFVQFTLCLVLDA
jgi:uncharacterized membrane protein